MHLEVSVYTAPCQVHRSCGVLPTVFCQSPPHHQAHGITTSLQCDVMSFSEEQTSIKLEKEMEVSDLPTLRMSQTELQPTDAIQPELVITQPADAATEC